MEVVVEAGTEVVGLDLADGIVGEEGEAAEMLLEVFHRLQRLQHLRALVDHRLLG